MDKNKRKELENARRKLESVEQSIAEAKMNPTIRMIKEDERDAIRRRIKYLEQFDK